MQNRPFVALGRALAAASIPAILALALVGCGDGGSSKPSARAEQPPEIKKANESMQNYIQSKKQK
jgi:hypothetical protein